MKRERQDEHIKGTEARNPKTDMTHEEMKEFIRNHWTGTDAASKQRLESYGIVIWRIANRQIVERWAYLESPHTARG